MAEVTNISWCHHTFNGWVGCTKISPACDHCYAEGWAKRSGNPQLWQGERRRTTEANWKQPLKWNTQASKDGTRPRVFCSSLADVFDNDVPQLWRTALFALIHDTPNLDWLLLTKRIGNAARMLENDPPEGIRIAGLPNVWLGATIANQQEADRDIPKLLATPARVRFLSCEPLLGPIDLKHVRVPREDDPDQQGWVFNALSTGEYYQFRDGDYWECGDGPDRKTMIDWVIAGGESGGKARPSHPDWFRSLKQQCNSAGVAFFMKQMGGSRDKRDALESIPEDLRIREWPDAS